MEIRVFENKEKLDYEAAKYFKTVLNREKKPVIGLATGSTPIGMYEKLIEMYEKGEVDFSSTTSYNLDEYIGLSKDHPQSYYSFMQENLFKHVNMKEENINIPNGEINPQEACEIYNNLLSEKEIDIQVLGIGSNGHVAFNEPGTKFGSVTHVVDLVESTINDNARFFDKKEDVPTQAVTIGLSNIMKSKKIILIATGSNKSEAIKKLIEGEITEDMPASILQFHPNVVIMTDREAIKSLF